MVAWWKARGGKLKYRIRFQMVAWFKARGGGSLNKEIDCRWSHGGRQRVGKFQERVRCQMVAWWKAKGAEV